MYVWVFTLSEIGDKFSIGGSEGGLVCAGGLFPAGGFCVGTFTLSEMVEKLPNTVYKVLIEVIYGGLDKEEVISTHSELFLLIFLAPE